MRNLTQMVWQTIPNLKEKLYGMYRHGHNIYEYGYKLRSQPTFMFSNILVMPIKAYYRGVISILGKASVVLIPICAMAAYKYSPTTGKRFSTFLQKLDLTLQMVDLYYSPLKVSFTGIAVYYTKHILSSTEKLTPWQKMQLESLVYFICDEIGSNYSLKDIISFIHQINEYTKINIGVGATDINMCNTSGNHTQFQYEKEKYTKCYYYDPENILREICGSNMMDAEKFHFDAVIAPYIKSRINSTDKKNVIIWVFEDHSSCKCRVQHHYILQFLAEVGVKNIYLETTPNSINRGRILFSLYQNNNTIFQQWYDKQSKRIILSYYLQVSAMLHNLIMHPSENNNRSSLSVNWRDLIYQLANYIEDNGRSHFANCPDFSARDRVMRQYLEEAIGKGDSFIGVFGLFHFGYIYNNIIKKFPGFEHIVISCTEDLNSEEWITLTKLKAQMEKIMSLAMVNPYTCIKQFRKHLELTELFPSNNSDKIFYSV